MQDFKNIEEAAEEARRMAVKVEEYLPLMRDLLQAVDEATGGAEKLAHNGEPGVWIPADQWDDVKRALDRAW